MATTDQPKTFTELQTDLISRIRDSSSDSGVSTIVQRYLNIALRDMHINPNVMPHWALRRAVLVTHSPYTTGSVDITTASSRTAVTGNSTVWTTANTFGVANARVGGKIKFGGLNEVYEVSAVGASSITLATQYTGDDLDDDSYTYFEDEYALAADFLKPADAHLFSTDLKIPLVGPMDFRRRYGRNDVSGQPRVATIIQLDFSGNATPRPRLVLHPYPDDEYSIPYWYVTSYLAVTSAGVAQTQMSSSDDEPIIPLAYRHALVFHALYHYYRDRKDDARSGEAKAEYVDIMQRAANDVGIGQQDRPRLVPMRSQRGRRAARRYQTGDEFDTMKV